MSQNAMPSNICAGLYVSDWRTACLADLEALNVGLVITAMTAEELDYYGIEAAIDFEGSEWLWVPVEDDDAEPIGAHFESVITAIQKVRATGKAVLIHCMAGISRSPTLAAAWLMQHYAWTADRALAYLKERRACISPNDGFLRALFAFDHH